MKRKIYTILMMTALLAACQETLEERADRESREYTEKHCPTPIAYQVTMDSMTFDKVSHTFGYHYSLSGTLDDSTYLQQNNPREMLLQQVKNSTNLKMYKDAGYSFRYVYHSEKNKATLFDVTFKQNDYQ
ncbi:MAG: hypothetical protein IJ929_03920 [Prevotella sp.]|nr:hypothetical protein [Prevotella sp.]